MSELPSSKNQEMENLKQVRNKVWISIVKRDEVLINMGGGFSYHPSEEVSRELMKTIEKGLSESIKGKEKSSIYYQI